MKVVVGFRDGPLAGEMRKMDLVGKRIVFLDGVTYEYRVVDAGLPVVHAFYVEPECSGNGPVPRAAEQAE